MKGEVIGINNSIASNGGGNEGVGFSIPINLARWIMDELISHGRVVRGALGVDLQRSYLLEDAIRMGLDRPRGAWIDKVYAESPAAKAGLNDGDVILRFGGAEITDLNHLINAVSMTQVGVPADVVIWRDRQELKLKVTVGEREQTLAEVPVIQSPPQADDPSGLVRRPDRPRAESTSFFAMGLELVSINPQLALRYGLPDSTKGAMIVAVEDDSPLARLCEVHDVVASINDEPVRSAEQAAKGISEHQDHGPLLLSVDRRVEGEIHRFSFRVP
jgi:serine protease Do